MKCDRRLYLTRDKSRVVEEGDTDAATLFVPEGSAIAPADAAKYRLQWQDGKIILPAPPAAPAAEAPAKAKKKTEDKAAKKTEDKAAKKTEDKATARPPDVQA